jgi:hypothetical protein
MITMADLLLSAGLEILSVVAEGILEGLFDFPAVFERVDHEHTRRSVLGLDRYDDRDAGD